MNLPQSHLPFTDKYFPRAREVLANDNFNPRVTMQIFTRRKGKFYGGKLVTDMIRGYQGYNISIKTLPEGSVFDAGEPLMLIEGKLQDIIELETMYLGIISYYTTLGNGGKEPNLEKVAINMAKIVDLVEGRPVYYFGARHWIWEQDYEISKACFKGGAAGCSTDAGGLSVGQKGIGTIPHALVLAYGSTLTAAQRFFHWNPHIPLTILIDTFNRELSDSVQCAEYFLSRIPFSVRIDTCGENVSEGGEGTGVTVESVAALRKALTIQGSPSVKIVVSSGFNAEKTKKFVDAEKRFGGKLFDSIGTGSVFDNGPWFATSDIVKIEGVPFSKTGRYYIPNDRLRRAE